MKVKVTGIEWDTEDPDELAKLPKEVIVNIEEVDVEEFIADKVSDQFGWCINQCSYEILDGDMAAAPPSIDL